MPDRQVKFGILVWSQYTDWPSLRDAGASVVVRGSEAAAQQVVAEIRRTNRGWDGEPDLVGTPDTIVEWLAPYLGIGFHSMFFDFPPPYD